MKTWMIAVGLLLISTSVFAMASKPASGTYSRCIWDVEAKAKKAGLTNPWVGGDPEVWAKFTTGLYASCDCFYLKRTYQPGQTCS